MRGAGNIIDVIEATFGEPLDAAFVARVKHLTIDDLQTLKCRYDDLASTFESGEPAAGEFWPVSHQLIPYRLERERTADAAIQAAMTQLLYAHGVIVPDRLGFLLAEAVNPIRAWSEAPAWVDDPEVQAERLAHYLESLTFLRPLVEAGLLVMVPRIVNRLEGHSPIDGSVFFDADGQLAEARLCAIEFIHGPEALADFQRDRALALKRKGHFKWSPPEALRQESRDFMEDAFDGVLKKLIESSQGLPGHLNLESHGEKIAFEWLVLNALPAPEKHMDTDAFSVVESLKVPGLSGLGASDLIALHQSDIWLDYRLALRRGLDRIGALEISDKAEGLASLREEMQALERSVSRTTKRSRFAKERATAGRDLVIGTVVAAGFSPILGDTAAATGFGVASAQSAVALLWSWLRSRDNGSEQAVSRCFGAFS